MTSFHFLGILGTGICASAPMLKVISSGVRVGQMKSNSRKPGGEPTLSAPFLAYGAHPRPRNKSGGSVLNFANQTASLIVTATRETMIVPWKLTHTTTISPPHCVYTCTTHTILVASRARVSPMVIADNRLALVSYLQDSMSSIRRDVLNTIRSSFLFFWFPLPLGCY